jgi:hypothetical protein
MPQTKESMQEITYQAIAVWVNSCVIEKHFEVCKNAARELLLNRYGAEEEYQNIVNAADIRLTTPSFKLIL